MINKEKADEYHYCGKGIERLIESYLSDKSPFIISNNLKFPEIEPDFKVISELKSVLFPRYWNRGGDYDPAKPDFLEAQLNNVGRLLFEGTKASWIAYSSEHEEKLSDNDIEGSSKAAVDSLLDNIGAIRDRLKLDVEAALNGDPAAKGPTEIIRSYPGFTAIQIYRIAHELYKQGVPYYPRELSEHAHSKTGIDIHPGAEIGDFFL